MPEVRPMGWEVRKNNRYFYIARKRDGRVVRKYVIRETSPMAANAALFMADGERHLREAREAHQRASLELRSRVGDLVRTVAEVNAELGCAVEAMLLAVGYHRFKRGPWRMARRKPTGDVTVESFEELLPDSGRSPGPAVPAGVGDAMVVYTAPENVPGAAALFARVRAGDSSAKAELRRWMRETNGQLDHYGDVAMRATFLLVGKITGGDPVWAIAVEEKVKAMTAELLGDKPTVLDRLLVRRVVNGWLVVHALELESAVRPPARMRDREYLESAIGKASKRLTSAVTELARVRRLNLPQVLVNITPPTTLPPPPPRMGVAEILETTNIPAGPGGTQANDKKATARKAPRKSSGEAPSRRGSRARSQQNGDSR